LGGHRGEERPGQVDGAEAEIEAEALRQAKISKAKIGRLLGVNRMTVDTFMKVGGIK
jgi:hypothetical protein